MTAKMTTSQTETNGRSKNSSPCSSRNPARYSAASPSPPARRMAALRPLSLGFGLGDSPHELRQAFMVERGDRRHVLLVPIDGDIAVVRHQPRQHRGVGRARIMRAVIGLFFT